MRTLKFNANIDPTVDPNQAIEQAQLAEALGFDGVLIQDHAYNPDFSATWTLIAAIGAVTNKVDVGANVLTSAFRIPAILAKEAATLDAITNGRVILGIGPGANADGIQALGGPRFSDRKEMYRAYRDALHIIRGLWDSNGQPFSYTGDVQSVRDVKFGPIPSRRIPILTGAMGPQSLKLTAKLGDGISASSSYVPYQKLPWFREQLDAGAAAHDRNPEDLFINYNVMGHIHDGGSNARPRNEGIFWGDVPWWIERLQTIRDMGVSRFTFWPVHGDKNDQLRRFIEDVASGIR